MDNIPRKPCRWRRRLLAWGRRTKDVTTMDRVLVVVQATSGHTALQIADTLGCARSHVYRTTRRFAEGGPLALLDGRLRKRARLANDDFDACVDELVRESPQDHGYPRPTWTRELLILVAEKRTGTRGLFRVSGGSRVGTSASRDAVWG